MAKLEEKARKFLDESPYVGVVTTLREDGSPHATIVWVDVEGDKVSFNTALGRAKPKHLKHDPRASVAAYVVKSADGLVVVTVYDDALAGNLTQEIVARIRDLIGAPGAYPRLAIKALQLIAEDFRIGVIPRWQRCCERLDLCTHSSITERKCMIRQNLDASLRRSSLMQSQGLPTFMNCKSLCAPNQLS